MRNALVLVSLCSLVGATAPVSQQTAPFLRGDYVEARTASVFAGACHYNSEYMTTGRDAIMAWNITDGLWNGTSLSGVRVMAVVSADDNLADATIAHESQLVIDRGATPQQIAAVTAALQAQCGKSLGRIVSVRTAAIRFDHQQRQYEVAADGFAKLSVEGMPNDECCKQPSMVWYSPLIPVTGPKVGFTKDAAYSGGETWERQGENSAFYGPFSFTPSMTASASGV